MKDGEIQGSGGSYRDRREQEAENVKFKTSPFESFLAEWTWGEVQRGGATYLCFTYLLDNNYDRGRCRNDCLREPTVGFAYNKFPCPVCCSRNHPWSI